MEVKIGDTVYFEYIDGEIGSMVVESIDEDEVGFILKNNTEHSCMYFHEALDENDPRVIEYKKKQEANQFISLDTVDEYVEICKKYDSEKGWIVDINKLIKYLKEEK